MASKDADKEKPDAADSESDSTELQRASSDPPAEGGSASDLDAAGQTEVEAAQPAHLGATRYVHAAFFAAGILGAYLSGKLIETIWNSLAAWPTAVRAVPALVRYAEEARGTIAMSAGAVVGVVAVVQTYRRQRIRAWADEVASELAKVTWPNREMVTQGTLVVVISSAVATVYIALLDKFWGFLTTLVYGA